MAGFKTCGIYPLNSSTIGVSVDECTDCANSANYNPSVDDDNRSKDRNTTMMESKHQNLLLNRNDFSRNDMMRNITW